MTKLCEIIDLADVETVHKAKSKLSLLLWRDEAGESVYIQRGCKGPCLRIVPEDDLPQRSLKADPQWIGKVAYEDEAIWEWKWREAS